MDSENLIAQVTQKFGPAIGKTYNPDGIVTFIVQSNWTLPVLTFLKEQLDFNFLTDLCGIQYPDRELSLGVVYHMHNFKDNIRVRIESFLPGDHPNIPTATGLFPTANWMERETFDFYGIIFDGHPNLKRILNVDYMDYFPMRKEYPLEDPTRHDKDDQFFGR
jgi:NADH-quinone oxidoreductase subunit C